MNFLKMLRKYKIRYIFRKVNKVANKFRKDVVNMKEDFKYILWDPYNLNPFILYDFSCVPKDQMVQKNVVV